MNVPVGHAAVHALHTRSDVAVHAENRYVPAGQSAVVHVEHTVSAVEEQAWLTNKPYPHTVQGRHAQLERYWPGAHDVMTTEPLEAHTASAVPVQATVMYWPAGQLVLHGAQTMSAPDVQPAVLYWPAGQAPRQ